MFETLNNKHGLCDVCKDLLVWELPALYSGSCFVTLSDARTELSSAKQ